MKPTDDKANFSSAEEGYASCEEDTENELLSVTLTEESEAQQNTFKGVEQQKAQVQFPDEALRPKEITFSHRPIQRAPTPHKSDFLKTIDEEEQLSSEEEGYSTRGRSRTKTPYPSYSKHDFQKTDEQGSSTEEEQEGYSLENVKI